MPYPLYDVLFVSLHFIVEPLRPTTVLNRQAATRFIEHSLPDLSSGKLLYSYTVFAFLPSLFL